MSLSELINLSSFLKQLEKKNGKCTKMLGNRKKAAFLLPQNVKGILYAGSPL